MDLVKGLEVNNMGGGRRCCIKLPYCAHLSIFLHECPEVQDVCPTLPGGLDTRLGVLPCYRVVAIERTSWRRRAGCDLCRSGDFDNK